jgi:hypothetical protein
VVKPRLQARPFGGVNQVAKFGTKKGPATGSQAAAGREFTPSSRHFGATVVVGAPSVPLPMT